MRTIGLTALILLVLCAPASAQDRLPDGGIAMSSGFGPVRAWYGQPTERYDHGILGDTIEGGALVVLDADGVRHELVLPEQYVFEDLTPRLVDLDGDGVNEIVTIRTDIRAGAAVAIYALKAGQLIERAATAPIGLPHRWLSIAAIGNFTNDRGTEIAIVKTPHIGGVLEIVSFQGNSLRRVRPPEPGYSTHIIGSRDLSLARAQDLDGDGLDELALPTQDRSKVVVLGFEPAVHIVGMVEPAGLIDQPIGRMEAITTAGSQD